MKCTDMVLMDSGESVMTLPLAIALCRAMFDLAREVPFSIRAIGAPVLLLSSDGDSLVGADEDLVHLLRSDPVNRPPANHPTHPADAVRFTRWETPEPGDQSEAHPSTTTLHEAILSAAACAAEGGNSGSIKPLPSPSQDVLAWTPEGLAGDPDLAKLVRQCVDALVQLRRQAAQILT